MNIDLVYVVFALAALASFAWQRPAVAALLTFLGGWLVLPVGHFPAGSAAVDFPYWIIGLALPSDMLLSKAWIAPAAAMLGVLAFDRAALMRWRPVWADAPMLLWCLWPALRALGSPGADPAGWLASLYLAGCWGLPWLLGRLYCADLAGQRLFVKALALAGAACLPFSLIEGFSGPRTYGWFYDDHPFRLDGAFRYFGYRPLGFFENGNQFGLWISLCALAAVWLALATAPGHGRRLHRGLAALTAAMALAAQSVGGILLLGMGLAVLWASRFVKARTLLVAPLALLLVAGAVYLSGVVPVAKIGKDTAFGQRVIGAFRAVGRGSFTWRIGQDQKLLADATARPLVGSADWAWWRSKETRPWGLALLVVGQFGLVGLVAGFGALAGPAFAAAWRAPRDSPWQLQALPLLLAVIVAMTLLDALMNSFVFFPAMLAAGGLAGAGRARDAVERAGEHRLATAST